jgi:hypothetical protein
LRRLIVAIEAIIILAIICSCSLRPGTLAVTYSLSGSPKTVSSITYTNETFGKTTIENAQLPWSKTVVFDTKTYPNIDVSISANLGWIGAGTTNIETKISAPNYEPRIFIDGLLNYGGFIHGANFILPQYL